MAKHKTSRGRRMSRNSTASDSLQKYCEDVYSEIIASLQEIYDEGYRDKADAASGADFAIQAGDGDSLSTGWLVNLLSGNLQLGIANGQLSVLRHLVQSSDMSAEDKDSHMRQGHRLHEDIVSLVYRNNRIANVLRKRT